MFPAGVFRQFKIYNTAVHASILSQIKEYIALGSKYLLCLLANNRLHRFHLVIYNDDDVRRPKPLIERYAFDFFDGEQRRAVHKEGDQILIRFEEDARRTLLLLSQQLRHLRPLKNFNTTFKYWFETTDAKMYEIDCSSADGDKEVSKFKPTFERIGLLVALAVAS